MNKCQMVRATGLLLSFLTAASLLGCGGTNGVVPVEGTVTLDGKPFGNVQVLFYLPGKGPETNFSAITDTEGRFTLASLRGKQPGVTPAAYSVSLTTAHWAPEATETDPPPRELVPPRMREHKFEVVAGGTKEANFELASK